MIGTFAPSAANTPAITIQSVKRVHVTSQFGRFRRRQKHLHEPSVAWMEALVESWLRGVVPTWDTSLVSPRRFGSSQRVALFLATAGRCAECGSRLEAGWHADHVTPRRFDGPTHTANGQALCPSCNLRKGGRAPTPEP